MPMRTRRVHRNGTGKSVAKKISMALDAEVVVQFRKTKLRIANTEESLSAVGNMNTGIAKLVGSFLLR